MKKTIFYVVAVSAMLISCQKNELVEPSGTAVGDVRILASFVDTKTVLSDEGDVVKTSWEKGDAIGVYGHLIEYRDDHNWNISTNARFVSEESGSKATFQTAKGGDFLWQFAWSRYTFYGYYPFSETAGTDSTAIRFTVPAVQKQAVVNSSAHIASTDLMYAMSNAAWNFAAGDAGKVLNFSFRRALSVLDVSLKAADKPVTVTEINVALDDDSEMLAVTDGSLDPRDGSLSLSAGAPEINLQLGEAASLTDEAGHFYVQITPGHAGRTLTVYAVVNGIKTKAGSVKIPASGIPVGVMAQLPVFSVEPAASVEYTDLSASGTSNCYIISAPGNYKFKATVKGNGNIPSALADVVSGSELTPKSALVLWYNTVQSSNSWQDYSPVVPASVSVEDGYICFSTPLNFIPGNVLIAAFAEDGMTYDNITVDENKCINNATLLWSWNIWAAEDYNPESNPIVSEGAIFMDRNLGAIISGVGSAGEYEPASAVGNFYQWGRKDPFPSFADYCNYWPCQYANQLLVTPTYTPIHAMGVNGQSSAKNVNNQMFGYKAKADGSFDNSSWHTIERNSIAAPSVSNSVYSDYAVAHPYVYVLNSNYPDGGYYPWLTTNDQSYRAFWGGSTRDKTLFDPCPAGWRVCDKTEAQSFIATVLSKAVLSSNLVGYEFDGRYLPMTGSRKNTDFTTENVKSCGYETKSYMWTSESNTNHNYGYAYAAAMIAPANYANSDQPDNLKEVKIEDNKYLASGCPVRCVKE